MINMKFNKFLWIFFFLILSCFIGFYGHILTASHKFLDIFSISIADVPTLKQTFSNWQSTPVDTENLFYYAWINKWLDFIWVLAYVPVVLIVSYNIRQGEIHPLMYKLLKFNFPLALLAGLLDMAENCILLYDMHGYTAQKHLISSQFVSWPKWFILFYLVFICLLSLFTRRLRAVNLS